MDIKQMVLRKATLAKESARILAGASSAIKNKALMKMADGLVGAMGIVGLMGVVGS